MVGSLSVSVGVVADIDLRAETRFRALGKALATPAAAVYTIARNAYHRRLRVSYAPVRLEGGRVVSAGARVVVEDRFAHVLAANVPFLAADFYVDPAAQLGDGILHLQFIRSRAVSVWGMLGMFLQVESGNYLRKPFVERALVSDLVIESVDRAATASHNDHQAAAQAGQDHDSDASVMAAAAAAAPVVMDGELVAPIARPPVHVSLRPGFVYIV